MILTDEQMRRMEMDARRFAGAYTGTSGTLASHTLNLICHIRESRLSRPKNEKLDQFLDWLDSFAVPSISHGECAMSSWIRVSDADPPVGRDVLVYLVDGTDEMHAVACLCEGDDGELYWESDFDEIHGTPLDYVTHWMELPPPPSR